MKQEDVDRDIQKHLSQLGHIEPKDELLIECSCGWHGTIKDCLKNDFSNDGWNQLSGRKGYFWHCPDCNEIVWRYYHTIS